MPGSAGECRAGQARGGRSSAKSQAGAAPPRPKAVKAPPSPRRSRRPRETEGGQGTAQTRARGAGARGLARERESWRTGRITPAGLPDGRCPRHDRHRRPAGHRLPMLHQRRGDLRREQRGRQRRSGPPDRCSCRSRHAEPPAPRPGSAPRSRPDSPISCGPRDVPGARGPPHPGRPVVRVEPGKTNPLDSAASWPPPVLRSPVSSRVASVCAAGLLARFGSGNRQKQVRAIAGRGPAAAGPGLGGSGRAQDVRERSSQKLADRDLRRGPEGTRRRGSGRTADDRDHRPGVPPPVRIVSFGESGRTRPWPRSVRLNWPEPDMQKMLAPVGGHGSRLSASRTCSPCV